MNFQLHKRLAKLAGTGTVDEVRHFIGTHPTVDINFVNEDVMYNALHNAVRHDNKSVVKYLLGAGADCNRVTYFNEYTPFMIACRLMAKNCFSLLLGAENIDTARRDRRGKPPLRALIDAQGNPEIRTTIVEWWIFLAENSPRKSLGSVEEIQECYLRARDLRYFEIYTILLEHLRRKLSDPAWTPKMIEHDFGTDRVLEFDSIERYLQYLRSGKESNGFMTFSELFKENQGQTTYYHIRLSGDDILYFSITATPGGSKGDYNVVLYFGKPHTESGVAAAYLHHGKNVNLGSYSYNKPHKESLTTTCLSTGTGTLRTLLALSFLSSSTGEVELTDESGVGDCDTRLAIIRMAAGKPTWYEGMGFVAMNRDDQEFLRQLRRKLHAIPDLRIAAERFMSQRYGQVQSCSEVDKVFAHYLRRDDDLKEFEKITFTRTLHQSDFDTWRHNVENKRD